MLLKERKAKTAVRLRRVVVEDGRIPGSTLVTSVKGKEGKDSGSIRPSGIKGNEGKDNGLNLPSDGGGWLSTGFDSC